MKGGDGDGESEGCGEKRVRRSEEDQRIVWGL